MMIDEPTIPADPPTWSHAYPAKKLSPREAECVIALAIGHASDESIGLLLGISPRTARFHITNAKTKLNATTRCQMIAIAVRTGEID